MKTAQEKEIEILRLKKLKKALPEFSFFGDNNWAVIDVQMDVIEEVIGEDEIYEREDELGADGLNSALDALEWLNGERSESLVSDEDIKNVEWDAPSKELKQEDKARVDAILVKVQKQIDRRKKQKEKPQLEQFRTRWMRWLGQKCRSDKPNWVTLLQSDWSGWVSKVCHKHKVSYTVLGPFADIEPIYKNYKKAIEIADLEDLQSLDMIYLDDKLRRAENRKR